MAASAEFGYPQNSIVAIGAMLNCATRFFPQAALAAVMSESDDFGDGNEIHAADLCR